MARFELPDDVLHIINDFSQPLTRPDWRSLHLMTSLSFHLSAAQTINRTFPRSVFEMVNQNDTGFKYNLEYYNGVPYIEYIYVPNGTTPLYVPF